MRTERNFRPRALGEIAIRCADTRIMADFYERVIGLERLSGDHREGIVFLRIAEGFAGHTAVMALFRHDAGRPDLHPHGETPPETGARSSLHHIALSRPFAEQQAVMNWYDAIGQPYSVQRFGWIGWQGIFTQDPEGNTVELVAYDPSLKDAP